MEQIVKILKIEPLTRDTKRFTIEKPKGFNFVSGQHCVISINKEGFEKQKRPFTITSSNDERYLEFTIKQYPEKEGITKKFHELKVGDEIILWVIVGNINYQGKGVFIAAGTGVNPFFSIMRKLESEGKNKGNMLIYSNKTKDDILLEDELKKLFDDNIVFILTREKIEGYEYGRIDKDFLKEKIKDFNQKFYVCGPFEFVVQVKKDLIELGVGEEDII